jgi:archaemetzincin
MIKIAIIPIGEADQTKLDAIARALRDIYGSETVIGNAVPVPEKTYNRRRRQYHSTQILKALETLKSGGYDIVLGVIDRDLYVPELNFVFGEADVFARIAVIGLPRLRQEYYGLEQDRALFLQRAAKQGTPAASATAPIPDASCISRTASGTRT